VSRYLLSVEAQSDLDEIRAYMTQQGGARLARYVLGEIRKALNFIADTPGAGHFRPDLTDQPVKFWSVFSYLIVYDPMRRPLGIARVLHAAQDLKTLFQKVPPRV
jgi:plasmid stabilization system protein ParE